MHIDLLQVWMDLFPRAPLDVALATYRQVEAHYTEPHRKYHGLLHLDYMLAARRRHFPAAPPALDKAIIGHDLFNTPTSKTNELESGAWASDTLIRLGDTSREAREVEAAIQDTASHFSDTELGQNLCDLDLLGLAAPPQVYRGNSTKIKSEYQAFGVTDEQWRQGRLIFIRLYSEEREQIYYDPVIRAKHEAKAHANMRAEKEFLLSVMSP